MLASRASATESHPSVKPDSPSLTLDIPLEVLVIIFLECHISAPWLLGWLPENNYSSLIPTYSYP